MIRSDRDQIWKKLGDVNDFWIKVGPLSRSEPYPDRQALAGADCRRTGSRSGDSEEPHPSPGDGDPWRGGEARRGDEAQPGKRGDPLR